MDSKAQKIIDAGTKHFAANKADCNKFVKAVANEFTETQNIFVPGDDADNIVDKARGAGWSQITDDKDAQDNITKRKELKAKEVADKGMFVIAGIKKSEIPDTNGHVAIILSGDMVYSGQNQDWYPVGSWGKLGGVGENNKSIAYSFGKEYISKVTYSAKLIT